MNNSIRLLTVCGIDIRVHYTFPLILVFAVLQFGVFAGQGLAGAIFGVIVTVLLFTIVMLHELGHSVATQGYGIPVNQIVLLPIGSVPGSTSETASTALFGGASTLSTTGQLLNILLSVRSSA